MRVRHLNRSRPLQGWLVLGLGLGGATLCGVPACNAILGNEAGHHPANGGSDGAAAGSGTGTNDAGDTAGGAPSGGASSSGAGHGGASNAGASNAGASNAGASNAGAGHGGASNAGASNAGAANAGAANAGAANGGAANGGAANGGAGGKAGAGGTAGAGGDTSSPYCTATVTECGGNLVGTWVAQSSCLFLPNPNPTIPTACQGADMYQRYKISGNITYTDTTWAEDYTQDTLETINYSASCIDALRLVNKDNPLPAPTSAATCSAIASNLAASSASCPFLNNGCLCSLTFTATGTTGDSYAKISNSEYINNKDSDGHPVSYCVKTVNGVTTLTTSESTTADYTFERVFTLSSR